MSEKVVTRSLVQHLFSQPETSLYTVLDGASVPELPQILWEHEPEHICLYRGELEPDMAAVAPYLVKLEYDHPCTKLVCEQGWGKHWGIFVITPVEVDIRMLRGHFRRFLMVYDPDGKLIYFRYYDPRVLRVYLPTCNAEEIRIVFGPISSYVLEDEDPSVLLRFSSDAERVRDEKVPLAQV
ncbi:MAG TPA: DUF4123 domain-containing protein [Sedimentisphaerales bacterium]|nr:DUF4123 domain-containing protein [Sedimentisphaerales bacterium]